MLELRLRSGQIVSFDGRVLEVFGPDGAAGVRLHIANMEVGRTGGSDGGSTLVFGEERLRARFAPEETAAADRLLAAVEQAQRADRRLTPR